MRYRQLPLFGTDDPVPFVPGSVKRNQAWIDSQGFSAKEREVLDLLILRYTPQSIAIHLGKSYRTVSTQIGNMVLKAHVANRDELVGMATDEQAELETGLRVVRSA